MRNGTKWWDTDFQRGTIIITNGDLLKCSSLSFIGTCFSDVTILILNRALMGFYLTVSVENLT